MNRQDILTNIDNPRQLEKLYRDNETAFKTEFNLLYPELTDNKPADYWNATELRRFRNILGKQ
jgi:hypothetical protein